MDDKLILKILKDVLNNYGIKRYSIDQILDSSICIVHENEKWSTFCYEKSNRFIEEQSDSLLDASIRFIKLLSKSQDEQAMITRDFLNSLYPSNITV